jgi:hypothetical protein
MMQVVPRLAAGIGLALALQCAGLAGEPPVRFTAPDAPLPARFARPPARDRILKIIHPWPDDAPAQDQLRERLLDQGFGGVVCNVAFDQYLESEPKWQAFVRAVTAAKADGMELWLYDERGYPSGNAGGLVLRDHPEWQARGLIVTDREVGPGPVVLDLPPGRLVLAAAYPIGGQTTASGPIDIKNQAEGTTLSWTAPAGRWQVLVITENPLHEGTHADGNLWQKMPYINLLEPGPTARFLELTHGGYAAHLGPDLGKFFGATFTDEPSLMSWFLKRMPYRPLPWSSQIAAEFKRRRGYDLEPILPDLVLDTTAMPQPADAGVSADTANGRRARHRHDFWLTVGELVSENFFGQIQVWCREHGLPSGGHLLAEESVLDHVPLYGDFFRCVRRLDAPSIDCLTSVPADVPWHVARLVASAAELEGRTTVMCETSDHSQVWRPAGDKRPKRIVTEAEIRGTCNRLLLGGVNTITSYYSWTDIADDALRRINEWVGRCATALHGGHQVPDVAVVYPAESLWTRFIPAQHWASASPQANRIGELYRTALDGLFEARRELTVVDSRTLADARVEAGALIHGPLRWRVVVLPGVDTLPERAWTNLARFAESGGVVIALGSRPLNSEREFPSAPVAALGRTLFGEGTAPGIRTNAAGGGGVFLPQGFEALLVPTLKRVLGADVDLSGPSDVMRLTHRRIDGQDVWFLANDSATNWAGEVRIRGAGRTERLDPASGAIVRFDPIAGSRIELGPYGAQLFRSETARLAARLPLQPDALPTLEWRLLPTGEPMVSRGEFVREEFGPMPAGGTGDKASWRASARLVKGGVDTFLFVRFPRSPGEGLAANDRVAIETQVPAGQRTANQLLVILAEEGGADYLATTPRSLGAPGLEQTVIPLSRFRLAGWSKDADGHLSPERVTEIRVGWGGYIGTENEQVEFSVARPQAVRVHPTQSDRSPN